MGASAWINLLLLSAALSGCATAPTPQWLDARALCRSSGKQRAIPRPRPSTMPTLTSVWWREATAPDESGHLARPQAVVPPNA
jgi:hypothetical protein